MSCPARSARRGSDRHPEAIARGGSGSVISSRHHATASTLSSRSQARGDLGHALVAPKDNPQRAKYCSSIIRAEHVAADPSIERFMSSELRSIYRNRLIFLHVLSGTSRIHSCTLCPESSCARRALGRSDNLFWTRTSSSRFFFGLLKGVNFPVRVQKRSCVRFARALSHVCECAGEAIERSTSCRLFWRTHRLQSVRHSVLLQSDFDLL